MDITEKIAEYLGEKKDKKEKSAVDKLRKPTAPPSKTFKDKSKYDRKDKHKKKLF